MWDGSGEHSLRLTISCPHQLVVGERVHLFIRPEWSTTGEGLPTTVERVRYQGSVTEYELHSPLGQLYIRQLRPTEYSMGQSVFWRPTQATVVNSFT
ncbi:TOBE domain-containing protein [Alicyclobacillus suci]|uniref:TOBE domain-containing protein n=1 Tax=Alicyclobacillus suci TaxID=2816080 RepID=UPI001A8E0E46